MKCASRYLLTIIPVTINVLYLKISQNWFSYVLKSGQWSEHKNCLIRVGALDLWLREETREKVVSLNPSTIY